MSRPDDNDHIINDQQQDGGPLDYTTEDGERGKRARKYVVAVSVLCILTAAGTTVGVIFGTRANPAKGSILGFNFEKDNADIHKMHSLAKDGKWNEVWPILDKKPYIINVIPENVSTAILHDAVLPPYSSRRAVERIIQYRPCDVLIRTRGIITEIGAGKTAEYFAHYLEKISLTRENKLYYRSLCDFIRRHSLAERRKRFSSNPPFFVTQKAGDAYNRKGLPLMLLTLSAYKNAFLEPDDLYVSPKTGFLGLLKIILNSTIITWEDARYQITSSLYGFDASAAKIIDNKGTIEDEFYQTVLGLYTSPHIYEAVNLALRRQALISNYNDYRSYSPAGDDVLLGPYILTLDAVLTFWDKLKVWSGVTYRGVNVNVTNEYKMNTKIVWLNFVSSSSVLARAEELGNETVFIIDNTMVTPWQPKSIEKHSVYEYEEEKLYPPGAEFLVTDVEGNHISLKLVHPKY